MRRPLLTLALAAIIVLLLAACGEGRGIAITGDGRLVDNTAENQRGETERRIEEGIFAGLPPLWRCRARIAEDPAWVDSGLDDGQWKWTGPCTVTIELAGGDPAHAPDPAPIKAEVQRFLTRKVLKPEALHIDVITANAAPAMSATLAAPAGGPRRYVVRAGDTLALLSSVYYGTPHEWRRILDANPGLDPAQLQIGQELTIP